jgi:hypothetical protein
MTPMPPACAMAIARRDSVTVSIAADRIGTLSSMSRAITVRTSVCPGITSEWPGCRRTSSKVSASAPVADTMIFAMAIPSMFQGRQRSGRPRRQDSFPLGMAVAGTMRP